MRELLTVQDGGGKEPNGIAVNGGPAEGKVNGDVADGAPLLEEEVEGIRQRTAAFLLGEGRYVDQKVPLVGDKTWGELAVFRWNCGQRQLPTAPTTS